MSRQDELKATLASLRPYIMNTKSLAGFAIIAFSLFILFTDVPAKWDAWNKAKASNQQLEDSKKNLHQEELKLQAISTALDSAPVKLATISPGQSPQLVSIGIAQKVVDLAEKAGNTYLSLQPGETLPININTLVNLPVNIAGVTSAAAPATVPTPAAAEGGASPAPAPPPAAPTPPPASQMVNANKYTLDMLGTYGQVSRFIYAVSQFPSLALMQDVELKPVIQGPDTKSAQANKIAATVVFYIPLVPQAATPTPSPAVAGSPAATSPVSGPSPASSPTPKP